MPREMKRELPIEVKNMPTAARAVWRAAFRTAIKEKPEGMAALLALGAVKKVFSRIENEEGEEEWVPKEEAAEAREAELAEAIRVRAGGDPNDPTDDPNAKEGEGGEGDDDDDAKTQRKGKKAAEDDPDFKHASNVIKAARAIQVASAGAGEGAGAADSITMTDMMTLDSKAFRLTEDGFLVANPRVARTGIQLYRGSEVGRPEMAEVRVYRPEQEVFNTAAMASLAHRPITLDHPDTKVDASNWRKLGVGKSEGDVARDGDFVRVPLMLMDASAILAAQSGKSQLSVGYGAKLVWGSGLTLDGEPYDAMQTEIRANHIALVSSARGGDKLKIGDGKKRAPAQSPDKSKPEGDQRGQQRSYPMTEYTTMNLDGVDIALEEKDGQILRRHLDALRKQVADAQALTVKIEELTKSSGVKDGEIAALNQKVTDSKLTPEKLDKALELRMDIVDRASTFFADTKYAWRGKTDQQIRRDVVSSRMGDQKAKAMDDAMIEGAFLSITEPEQQDGFQRFTQSFSQPPAPSYSDKAASAYDKRNQDLANRWQRNKGKVGSAA